ncbi:FtsQ-type POTRA domain-containing protein [Leucobacter triazinivorans]|uniref:FtsQ-type POTRA domain-containing protein n=1 Tax=Leucobacter triazinivorans TaxID=1784719 RepID=A0A4P6KIT6_9MICO|nr:FtsQ-type POTRA domain-containing protein [Leucobacter triazinivorans]QBE49928.1 FtsQ-type POTRA domain-containing protein [Leucobacter triazinivorans]
MKRPSGFDRAPEPERRAREPERRVPEPERPVPAAPESIVEPVVPQAPDPEPHADASPTVDLGELREARSEGLTEAEPHDARSSPLARLRARRGTDPVRAAERRVRAAGRQHRARLRRERRRFAADARRRRRNAWIAVAAVVALGLFVVVGAFTPLMAVREVQVIGASAVNQSEVEQALVPFDGRPLALVDDADVHRALEPFPLIQRYAVERVPPHTLVVRIEERVPVVSVSGDAGYSFYDAAGVLLGRGEEPPAGVPVASGSVADLSSAAFQSAARTLRDMPSGLREQIVGVEATSAQDVAFTLGSGVRVLWGDSDRTQSKAAVLQTMVTALGDRPLEVIDVSSPDAPVFR